MLRVQVCLLHRGVRAVPRAAVGGTAAHGREAGVLPARRGGPRRGSQASQGAGLARGGCWFEEVCMILAYYF